MPRSPDQCWRELPSIRCRPSITAAWFKNKRNEVELQPTPEPSSPTETASVLVQGLKFIPQNSNDFTAYYKEVLSFKEPCCTKAWSHQTQFQKKVFCRFFFFISKIQLSNEFALFLTHTADLQACNPRARSVQLPCGNRPVQLAVFSSAPQRRNYF